MGNLILTSQYSQNITSEEATAALNDVVKGKTALTSDSNDNLGIGTLELTGNTNPAHVLISNTFYTTDPHTKQIGTMPNNPAQNATLTCGQSKTLPAGYIPGGTITAATLASQTGGATATDAYVRSGYTYWKDGVKRTGAMTVSSVVSFSAAAYSTSQILCTWKNPAKGPYSGVAICAKTGGYPANINDNRKYTGVGNNSVLNGISTVIISGLTAGITYYFRIWVYCTCSAGDLYSGYLQASCAPTAHGRQAFTSSGIFTVPANVRSIDIHCTGGGARGGSGTREASGDYDSGGGGGGGYTAYKKGIAVTPGSVINIIVGRGGWLSYNSADYNTTGEGGRSNASRSGIELCAAAGGTRKGSGAYPNACGGHGGSGGGGGTTDSYRSSYGYGGGSDGGTGTSRGRAIPILTQMEKDKVPLPENLAKQAPLYIQVAGVLVLLTLLLLLAAPAEAALAVRNPVRLYQSLVLLVPAEAEVVAGIAPLIFQAPNQLITLGQMVALEM